MYIISITKLPNNNSQICARYVLAFSNFLFNATSVYVAQILTEFFW